MRTLRSTAIGLALALSLTAFGQEKATLRYKIEVGKPVTISTTTDMAMSFSGMFERETKMKTSTTQALTFEGAPDGWLKFTFATTDMKMEGDSPMEGMGGDPSAMAEALKKVRVVGFTNEIGATKEVRLADSDALDPMSQGAMARVVEQFSQLGFFGLEYPKDEVGVGTKWSKDFDMAKSLEASMMGMAKNVQAKMPTDYEVVAFESLGGTPHLKMKFFSDGKATFDVSTPNGDSPGTMTLTVLGHSWIDLATGLPTKTDTEMAMNIDMGMLQIAQEMKTETKLAKN